MKYRQSTIYDFLEELEAALEAETGSGDTTEATVDASQTHQTLLDATEQALRTALLNGEGKNALCIYQIYVDLSNAESSD